MNKLQKTLISIVISCISLTGSFAQKSISTDIIKKINHISDLITHDQITELASLIKFPIIMQNPIPDILY